jgi:hypothetical protein
LFDWHVTRGDRAARDGKAKLAPPGERSTWRCLIGVQLGDGEIIAHAGDSIGVVTALDERKGLPRQLNQLLTRSIDAIVQLTPQRDRGSVLLQDSTNPQVALKAQDDQSL